MPEGQAVHRLAAVLNEQIEGEKLSASSPQGRFTEGAARINGLLAGRAEAWGKHLFLPFAESPQAFAPRLEDATSFPRALWLHVHLGLYGRWSFSGPRALSIEGPGIRLRHHAININETSEEETAESDLHSLSSGESISTDTKENARRNKVAPTRSISVAPVIAGNASSAKKKAESKESKGSTIRLRLGSEGLYADLTGPHRCQIFSGAEVEETITSLGPDPIRNNPGDRDRFINVARRRKIPIGQLVMDQSVAAGPGNIYRADCLWRVGISPNRPGNQVSEKRLGILWDDLVSAMRHDLNDGVIRTIPLEFQPEEIPEDDKEIERFVVYHRTGRPCPRCGTRITEKEMAGRRLFWCPGCQH